VISAVNLIRGISFRECMTEKSVYQQTLRLTLFNFPTDVQ
jgi:hypothetical protein